MALITSVIKEDGTGDYTSLQAWDTDRASDLRTTGNQEKAEIQGTWSSADGTSFTLAGWTTDVDEYAYVEAVGDARHNGAWSETAWRIERSLSGDAFIITEFYCYAIGVQAKMATATATLHSCFQLGGAGDGGRYEACLAVLDSQHVVSQGCAFEKVIGASQTADPWVINCLAIEIGTAASGSFGFWEEISRTSRAVHCSAIGFFTNGFLPTNSAQARHMNCLEQGSGGNAWSRAIHADSRNNLCHDTSLDGGTGNVEEATVTFQGATYQPAATDTVAVNAGWDASAYTTVDIAGNTRVTHDIGCFAAYVEEEGGGEDPAVVIGVIDVISLTRIDTIS